MATDFAVFLRRFLTSHLAGLRGCSPNTIASYRDTFKLLIAWFSDVRSVPPGKLTLDRIDAHAVTGFLQLLEPNGATASPPATSAWPRSARSAGGCRPRTRPGWPAGRKSPQSPPKSRPARP